MWYRLEVSRSGWKISTLHEHFLKCQPLQILKDALCNCMNQPWPSCLYGAQYVVPLQCTSLSTSLSGSATDVELHCNSINTY